MKRIRNHQPRRWMGFALALLLSASALPAPVAAETYGDITGDGQIGPTDALYVLQYTVELKPLDKTELRLSDINFDGENNASDALLMLQHSVGLAGDFAPPLEVTVMPWNSDAAFSQTMEAVTVDGIKTYYQTAYPYTGIYNFESDAIMAYCNGLQWAQEENRYLSWVKSTGKKLAIMIKAGGVGDEEDYQHNPDLMNDPEMAYGDIFADTENFIEYKWKILDTLCSRYSPEAVCIEEPHWQKRGGRSELFQRVYQETYGIEWEHPDISAESRWKSAKLKGKILEEIVETLGNRVKETYPEVQYFVATHSTIGYNQWDHVDDITAYAKMDCVDAVIGQSWSDPQINVYPYGGELKRQVFEQGYLAYAGFAGLAGADIDLFTLTDPKIDTPADYTWDDFATWYKSAVTAQLLQQKVHRFQETIWPERSFAYDTPDDFKSVQLNTFAAMNDLNGEESTLYAGTPGISVGMSDTLTWQSGNFMAKPNSNNGFCGLTIPLIEKGIPLGVTSLDLVKTKADLEGVRLLILSYDCMKPLAPEVNQAVADWVKDGGVLLYVGGHDDFETLEDEWWQKEFGQTPLEHLIAQLGLDVQVGRLDQFDGVTWKGDPSYCASFQDLVLTNGLDHYSATFTGSGFTPIMESSDGRCLGLRASAGKGTVLMLGVSSPSFTAYESSPQMMREITEYACRFAGVQYLESEIMAVRRGNYLSAQGMTGGKGSSLKGDFVDLFDGNLSLTGEKTVAAGESVLLYDISSLRTQGIPRVAYVGANSTQEIVETAEQTALSVSVPHKATASIRVLTNGRTLSAVQCTARDQEKELEVVGDGSDGSILLRLTATTDREHSIVLTWAD